MAEIQRLLRSKADPAEAGGKSVPETWDVLEGRTCVVTEARGLIKVEAVSVHDANSESAGCAVSIRSLEGLRFRQYEKT